ncbi:hypothetical protein G6F57_018081 [Rhizopus arrhizus]|nr:hypothetical protein G6F57_018081 [Rhizopus arrhizus]
MQRGATEPAKEGARLTLDELKAIQTLSADSLGKTLASLRQVAERKTVLEREIEALHDQLNVLQGQLSRRTKTVTLRVNLARAGKVDLAVSYAVGGARWTPAYDARLRPADPDLVHRSALAGRRRAAPATVDHRCGAPASAASAAPPCRRARSRHERDVDEALAPELSRRSLR